MLAKKFSHFQDVVNKTSFPHGNKPISEAQFDDFINTIFSNSTLNVANKIYCRDGFARVIEIDYNTYQILAFQINTFGKGAFGNTIKKLITPLLVTIKTHGNHKQAEHSLSDTSISIEDIYLGENYCGSMGDKCDREEISKRTKEIFLNQLSVYSYNHQIIYELINTNFVCHHVAETMSYAFGALNFFWKSKQKDYFMVSASYFSETLHKLKVEIIDNFSGEKMRNFFDIPHYAKLMEDLTQFKEDYGQMLWEVTFKKDVESFHLPVGFQKTVGKRYQKSINVVTTQHIVDHILRTYYRRKNSHLVTNTYQILEFLSRGFIAKMEGNELGGKFIKSISTCMGHYPDREFSEVLEKMQNKYHIFESDFSHTNFFRPPVL